MTDLAFLWAMTHNAFTGSYREQSRLIFKSPAGCWKPTSEKGELEKPQSAGF
jgi:hypothetical protein